MSDINKTYVFETVLVSGGTTGTTSGSTSDDYTTNVVLDNNILEFTRLSGGTYSVDLSTFSGTTNGPITFECDTNDNISYIGYGEENACKIKKVTTLSGSTYTAFWSNGEETLNKIWSNRYTYTYF